MDQKKITRSENILTDSRLNRIIEEAIAEDVGIGDITSDSLIPPDLLGKGDIIVKEKGIVAGLKITALVFQYIDPQITVTQSVSDGTSVDYPDVVASVDGPLAAILKGERTALNFLQRMSGIATLTRKFVDAVKGTNAKITDTRKTVPTLRIIDKLAVRLGGGINHRFGLYDMVIIKDNHIAAAGGIGPAIESCLAFLKSKKSKLKIEVETKSIKEVRTAIKYKGLHRIMLDNFSIQDMREAVHIINRTLEVEASGNVSLNNVREIAETGVDFISIGALTHSAKSLDISLELKNLPLSPPS